MGLRDGAAAKAVTCLRCQPVSHSGKRKRKIGYVAPGVARAFLYPFQPDKSPGLARMAADRTQRTMKREGPANGAFRQETIVRPLRPVTASSSA